MFFDFQKNVKHVKNVTT